METVTSGLGTRRSFEEDTHLNTLSCKYLINLNYYVAQFHIVAMQVIPQTIKFRFVFNRLRIQCNTLKYCFKIYFNFDLLMI